MLLNARNNNFIISFKRNFLYPKIVERYKPVFKMLPYPYEEPIDFLNASIQQFTFPGVNAENVEQVLYEDNVQWKGAYRMGRLMEKDFTITFKLFEGCLNYWMMFDQLQEFLAYDNDNEFLPDITLSFLDHDGFELISIEFHQITMKSISELDLNYSNNTPEFQTFSCDFHYNYFTLKRRLD